MNYYRLFCLTALSGASLFAQSEADLVARAVKDLPATNAQVHRTVLPFSSNAAPTVAPLQNVFAILGDNYQNNSVPCFNCVPGALGPALGIPTPDTYLHADGNTSYVMVNYFVDQTYTGSCSWNFLVQDAAGKYIVRLRQPSHRT